MKHWILALAIALAGCTSTPTIVTETKYVVRTAPADIKKPPVREPSADAQINRDDEAAVWVILTEAYIVQLEDYAKRLIKFYERPIE